MSYSIDVNLLLYASDVGSVRHLKARGFLDSCAASPELLCLTWPTLISYLRIATHPRIFGSPLSPTEALSNIEALLALPQVRAVGELDGFLNAYSTASDGVFVRGNLVPDAHVAAIMLQHGVRTLYSHDRDFHKFTFLEVRDPFSS